MKFSGYVCNGTRNDVLEFGGDLKTGIAEKVMFVNSTRKKAERKQKTPGECRALPRQLSPPPPSNDPDHPQNLISCSWFYGGPFLKVLSKYVKKFFSYVANRQTNPGQNNLLCGGK